MMGYHLTPFPVFLQVNFQAPGLSSELPAVALFITSVPHDRGRDNLPNIGNSLHTDINDHREDIIAIKQLFIIND
jgi:hypothetical protein